MGDMGENKHLELNVSMRSYYVNSHPQFSILVGKYSKI